MIGALPSRQSPSKKVQVLENAIGLNGAIEPGGLAADIPRSLLSAWVLAGGSKELNLIFYEVEAKAVERRWSRGVALLSFGILALPFAVLRGRRAVVGSPESRGARLRPHRRGIQCLP